MYLFAAMQEAHVLWIFTQNLLLEVDFHDLPVQVKTLYPRVVPDIPNNMNS